MTVRKLKLIGILLTIGVLLASCASWKTAQGRTETVVISYESLGMIAFPTVLAYLQEREKNGSLSGDDLIKAKEKYKFARESYIHAGDALITYVKGGTQQASLITQVSALLRQVAVVLADLSAGKVEGQTLTMTKAGGK